MNPKVIILDLETFGLKATDPILCISWKELGKSEVHFRAAWNYPSWDKFRAAKSMVTLNDTFQNLDKEMLKELLPILESADSVVAHYGNRFDIPFVKTRLLKHRLGFLPKSLNVDTWRIARDHLCMFSNRLASLNEFFGITKKLKQSNLDLWTGVKFGNKFAMKEMERYNKRDVLATESLMKLLIGYAKMPLASQAAGRVCVKPGCGGGLQSKGLRGTASGSYQLLRCVRCGSTCKGMKLKHEARPE